MDRRSERVLVIKMLLHNGLKQKITWPHTPFLAFLWTSHHSMMNIWSSYGSCCAPTLKSTMTCKNMKFPRPSRPTLSFLELQSTSAVRGWPDSLQEVDALAKPFWSIRHQLNHLIPVPGYSLSSMNGRTVIPSPLQKKILLTLHEEHQGIDKTRRLLTWCWSGNWGPGQTLPPMPGFSSRKL